MLNKRFGDSLAVASAFCKRLEAWPQTFPRNAQGLRKYTDFLIQCENAMEKISNFKVLNNDQENHRLTSKLPRWAFVR